MEYLQAMEIPVWVLREREPATVAAAAPAPLHLGPGQGQVLILCAAIDEPSRKISADLARSLKAEPVWGWPAPGDGQGAIDEAVSEKLFTHILVLGSQAEALVFGGPAPDLVGSASVLHCASVATLEADAAQRRNLWTVLCQQRLAGPRNRPGGQ